MRLTISFLEIEKEKRELIAFLHRHNPGYPGYHDWVDRTSPEFDSGYKGAVLTHFHNELVAAVVYQPDKLISNFIEIKSARVHPEMRGRDVVPFSLKQLEVKVRDQYVGFVGDVRAENRQTLSYTSQWGFVPIMSIPLYGDGKNDVKVVKLFGRNGRKILTSPLKNRIIKVSLDQSIRN